MIIYHAKLNSTLLTKHPIFPTCVIRTITLSSYSCIKRSVEEPAMSREMWKEGIGRVVRGVAFCFDAGRIGSCIGAMWDVIVMVGGSPGGYVDSKKTDRFRVVEKSWLQQEASLKGISRSRGI